jgi:hypothetical protein
MVQGAEKMYKILVECTGLSFSFGNKKPTDNLNIKTIVTTLKQDIDDDLDDDDNCCSLVELKKERKQKRDASKRIKKHGCKAARKKKMISRNATRKSHLAHRKLATASNASCLSMPTVAAKQPKATPKCSPKVMKPMALNAANGDSQRTTYGDSSWQEPTEKSVGWNLRRNANRRITRFLSLLCSLKGVEPDLFVSLSLPHSLQAKLSITEILGYYKRFRDKLKYYYRNSHMWAIWKLEYSTKSLIHMHLYIKLNTRIALISSRQKIKATKDIRRLFSKTIGVNKKKSVKAKYFGDWHYSYLAKKEKRGNEAHLISLIGKRQMFNTVNDKYIRVYKDIDFQLTIPQFIRFKKNIISNMEGRGDVDSVVRQFRHKHGHVSFIPRQTIARAILYAIGSII